MQSVSEGSILKGEESILGIEIKILKSQESQKNRYGNEKIDPSF